MMLDQIDYAKVKTAFLKELKLAAAGKTSSISFIKHTLPDKPLLTHGKFQGIVVGGTNYVDSTRQILKDGSMKTLTLKYGTLPIFKDRQMLVEFFTKHLDKHADIVGINFGFPLKPIKGPFGEIDGELVHGTKEHTFLGVTTSIGSIVREIYETKYKKVIPVSVANDSVCLTISGDGTERASIIVGTGINISLKLFENKKTILVNLEAGNFNKFPISQTLKKIDKSSTAPGGQLFEKVVSGKYLVIYFNEKAKELGLKIPQLTNSKELSELAEKRSTQAPTILARAVMERSASLVATAAAALYEFLDKPEKFTIITEGSVFWKGWKYQDNVYQQLTNLVIPEGAITFKHIQDSSIKGAIGLLTK